MRQSTNERTKIADLDFACVHAIEKAREALAKAENITP